MTTPRPSKLDTYADLVFGLHRQGRTLSEIVRHLAQEHGIRVAASTLSTFLKRAPAPPALAEAKAPPYEPRPVPATSRPPAPEPVLNNGQQNFLDQAEVFAELQASQTLLLDEWAKLHALTRRIGEDVTADSQRTQALLDALAAQVAGLRAAPAAPTPNAEALRAAVADALRTHSTLGTAATGDGRVAPWILLRIWRRAFWYSSLFWLALTVALASGALRVNLTLADIPGARSLMQLWLTASVKVTQLVTWLRDLF